MNPSLLAKALPFLKKALPIGVATKAIANTDPKLKRFIGSALASGYAIDEVLNFMRSSSQTTDKRKQESSEAQRAAQGIARPDELARESTRQTGAHLTDIAKKATQLGIGVGTAAFGAPIASAIGGALGMGGEGEQPAQEAPQEPQVEDGRNFFQRALEGVSFFDLDDNLKAKIGSLKKPLDNLETQGAPWEHKSVQKIVNAIRSLTGGAGMVEQEAARQGMPPQGEQQAQQGPSADEAVLAGMERLMQMLGK